MDRVEPTRSSDILFILFFLLKLFLIKTFLISLNLKVKNIILTLNIKIILFYTIFIRRVMPG
jgi:hypothetical protein